jgi:phosphoribosyl 1,2-cyclic phosphodiesterase
MTRRYVRFWGVRGSHPAPFSTHMRAGGNTSCIEVRYDDHILVCDAGSGIIALGEALMAQDRVREVAILVTHYHWDHISGLPFFQPAFTPSWTLRIFGPGDDESEVAEAIAQQMRAPYFPVETEEWLADVRYLKPTDGCLEHGPIRAYPFHTHHPGTTFGYRLEVAGKTVVYVSDNELLFLDRPVEQRLAEGDLEPGERELLVGMKEEARAQSLEGFRGADILIHDAQYTPEDYARKRGWGHSCYIDTVNCAIDAGVRELYLYHLDPSYPDDQIDGMYREALGIIHARRSPLRCHVAREGLIIDLES